MVIAVGGGNRDSLPLLLSFGALVVACFALLNTMRIPQDVTTSVPLKRLVPDRQYVSLDQLAIYQVSRW